MVPVAVGGILVDAAPDGIDELELRVEGLARHGGGGGIAGLSGASMAIFDVVPVEIFVLVPQPPCFVIVAGAGTAVSSCAWSPAAVKASLDERTCFDSVHRRAGRRIVDDGLQHRGHLFGREIALALDDLAAVGVEDDRGGPAVILVAIGEVGPRILIDAHGDVARVDQRDDLRDRGRSRRP